MKECNQCGKCCTKYGGGDLSVTQEEIELWEMFNPEIFEYVKHNQIWHCPQSGLKLERCPFLEVAPNKGSHEPTKYICRIYLDRPDDCRQYPSLVTEMIRDECEMIEVTDLNNLNKSQTKLDILMQDTRPASFYRK